VSEPGRRVGDDRQQLADVVGRETSRLAGHRLRSLDGLTRVSLHQPHADEEPVEGRETGEAPIVIDEGRLPGSPMRCAQLKPAGLVMRSGVLATAPKKCCRMRE